MKSSHGSQMLIADGNYPIATHTNLTVERVYHNLRPGLVSVPDILATLVTAISVEAVTLMQTSAGEMPAIATEVRELVPQVSPTAVERLAFYDLARQPEVALVIASGDA